MAEVQIDTGVTGAKRQSWRRANPRDVLKRILDKEPDLTEDDAGNECWDIIHRDPAQMRTVFEYWFTNNYRSLVKPRYSTTPRGSAAVKIVTAAISSQIEQKIEERVKIVLLDMMLPNGKPLRNSTREELVELGGWAGKIAEKLQPNETVEQAGLSESQLRELYGS